MRNATLLTPEHRVTQAEFDALVSDVLAAMQAEQITARDVWQDALQTTQHCLCGEADCNV